MKEGNDMAKNPAPWLPEINQYTIKFLIGFVALSLPVVELVLSGGAITSISESYWYPDSPWSRNIFVGSLYAIAALLASYNGTSAMQLWLGKVAALAAVLISMFPCNCRDDAHEIVKGVHAASAGILFAVLAWFCWDFIDRAKRKLHDDRRKAAARRIAIYRACGLGMLIAIGLFVAHAVTKEERLIFWGETFGLVSFGISWLTASHKLPGITHPSEKETVVGLGPARPAGAP
jgi:hypothetical protein